MFDRSFKRDPLTAHHLTTTVFHALSPHHLPLYYSLSSFSSAFTMSNMNEYFFFLKKPHDIGKWWRDNRGLWNTISVRQRSFWLNGFSTLFSKIATFCSKKKKKPHQKRAAIIAFEKWILPMKFCLTSRCHASFWYRKIYLNAVKRCALSITPDTRFTQRRKVMIPEETELILFVFLHNTGSFSHVFLPLLASHAVNEISDMRRHRNNKSCHMTQCLKNGRPMVSNR